VACVGRREPADLGERAREAVQQEAPLAVTLPALQPLAKHLERYCRGMQEFMKTRRDGVRGWNTFT
jgi:hypothetical protein